MKSIYCDESGYSGNNLIDVIQPFFVYAGVQLSEKEAEDAYKIIQDNYLIQRGGIKGADLVQNEKGQNAAIKLFEKYGKHARLVYCNKQFALACIMFEYAIEPIIKNNTYAYDIGFHRFISNSIYNYFLKNNILGDEIFKKFLAEFSTNINPESIFKFDINQIDDKVMKWVLLTLQNNEDRFYKEISTNEVINSWYLNLTTTSLCGILSDFGSDCAPLEVICDNSNLFKDENVLRPINKIGKLEDNIGSHALFMLAEDIKLQSAKKTIGLKVADIFASSLGFSLRNKTLPFSKWIYKEFVLNCMCKPYSYCIDYEDSEFLVTRRGDYFKLMDYITL